jgi:hypothetical protein
LSREAVLENGKSDKEAFGEDGWRRVIVVVLMLMSVP